MFTNSLILEEKLETIYKESIEEEQQKISFEELEEETTDSASDISLSEKIIIESNEKRLCEKMTSLQNSINNLKEQFQDEKQHWKDSLEKLKTLQQQQQDVRCMCSMGRVFTYCHNSCNCGNTSRSNSIYSLISHDCFPTKQDTFSKPQHLEQMLELYNYKQKLSESENMCNLELIKLKQNLQELKHIEVLTSDWDRADKTKFKPEEID